MIPRGLFVARMFLDRKPICKWYTFLSCVCAMAKARLVQLRVPEELLRRIDRCVSEGLYKSRSEVIVDATRRFLERSAPASPLEGFIESYLKRVVKPSKHAQRSLDRIFGKLRNDRSWHARFGDTPEEVMRSLRSRAI